MNTQKPIVSIQGLRKSFGDHTVLHGIDFDIQPSQVVVVIGPSGSGKSTFLRCCNGLEQPDSGRVEICGHILTDAGQMLGEQALNHLREDVGMVFQSFNLFPHLPVIDNITIGPCKVRGVSRKQAEVEAMALLDKVGLLQKAHAMPASLSGGQKQRVAIARALVTEPACVLADEPTGNLDRENGDRVFELLLGTTRSRHASLVLVTHDRSLAARCDRVLELTAGRLEESAVAG